MTGRAGEQVLMVQHVAGSDPSAFEVLRLADGRRGEAAVVAPPVGFPVEGRPSSDLATELQWYLERFLDYPFSPETEHADRVQAALRSWGEQAFTALFAGRGAQRYFDQATDEGYARLHLQISSDDPRVLAWPWEALH